MKTMYFLVALIATAFQANAQENFFDKLAVEASYGYNAPISPTNDYTGTNKINRADYSGFRNLQLGLNYEINDSWGVRGTYMLADFKKNDEFGTKIHKLALDAVYTLYDGSTGSSSHADSRKGFATYAHAGFGVAINRGYYQGLDDYLGTIQVGLKPTYYVSKNFGVFLNPMYVFNLNQNSGFDGRYLNAESDPTTGSFYTVNIGVSYHFSK